MLSVPRREPQILANLIVGSNGATSLKGSSRGISNPEDRRRLLEIRSLAKALCIGGGTFRSEPYLGLQIPVYVATKADSVTSLLNSFENENELKVMNLPPAEIVKIALKEVGGPILIEGGVRFLSDLISSTMIERIYLSRSRVEGDADFLDETDLRRNYKIVKIEVGELTVFEIWEPINQ